MSSIFFNFSLFFLRGDTPPMSRPHYPWWGYVKEMIRRYPERQGQVLEGIAAEEQAAVQAAIDSTKRYRNGGDRMRVVELVLWNGSYTIAGAAMQIPCSERIARQWHGDFIKAVARNFRCNGLLKRKDCTLEP